MASEFGYLYVAAGQKYIDESINSAASLKRICSQAKISIVADREVEADIFDQVIIRPITCNSRAFEEDSNYGQGWLEGLTFKVRHMYTGSPYDRTLFIDSDTYFYEDCQDTFELLKYFDAAMTLAPSERAKTYVDGEQLAGYFPYNTGVIFFQRNSENEKLFAEWLHIYEAKLKQRSLKAGAGESDQTAFMEALLRSKSRIYVLPNDYNARLPYFANFNRPVKIVHGRHENYEELRDKINTPQEHRAWHPQKQICLRKKKDINYYFERAKKLLKI